MEKDQVGHLVPLAADKGLLPAVYLGGVCPVRCSLSGTTHNLLHFSGEDCSKTHLRGRRLLPPAFFPPLLLFLLTSPPRAPLMSPQPVSAAPPVRAFCAALLIFNHLNPCNLLLSPSSQISATAAILCSPSSLANTSQYEIHPQRGKFGSSRELRINTLDKS